jgi:hypothetical protein
MNTKRIIFGLFIAVLSFTSCSDDEGVDFQTNPLSLNTEKLSVDETDESIDVMVNITESRTIDLIITYEIGGTAVDGVDYTSNNERTVTIPANSLNAEINLSLIDNDIINELRDITFRITEVSDSSLTVNNSETITVSIIDDESYKYRDGVLVINQGGFGTGDASVSFLSDDLTFTENNIFSATNSSMLGDTGQSIAFNDNLAYIVLNGSNKVEIVNRYSFASVATIDTGLANPRYMAFANGMGYLTNWGDGFDPDDDYVALIDLNTYTVTSTIAVSEGPERIINVNGSIYISNKGGYNQGNVITKIDANNTVSTINTGDVPDEMIVDAENNIWVVCEGIPSWTGNETGGKLIKINSTTDTVVETLDFAATAHPEMLNYADGNIYYYENGAIYKMDENDTNLPTSAIIIQNLDFGGLAIKNNMLFGTKPDYIAGTSDINIYNLNTNTLEETVALSNGAYNIYSN